MCDDCLLTRREAAYLIRSYREGEYGEAYTKFFERMVWSLAEASDELETFEIEEDEVDRIWDSIEME